MENKRIIQILVVVIVVLALIIGYFFIVKPMINKSATDNQVIGFNLAIQGILQQLQQQGFVRMTIGNQTLILVPYQQPQNATQ
ncbi:MAG: hypothetical protein AABY22_16150 [Nanoarchaeota archaeon]